MKPAKKSPWRLLTILIPGMVAFLLPTGIQAADEGSGGWALVARMNEGRRHHTATLLADGKVLVAGGCTQKSPGPLQCPTNSSEIYDPSSDKWTQTGAMVEPRVFHTASLLSDGKVLVAGGCKTFGTPDGCPGKTAELFDPASGKWSKTGDLNAAQANHTAAALPDAPSASCGQNCGKVLMVGSIGSPAELFDSKAGTWQIVEGEKDPGSGSSATLLPGGQVMVVGTGQLIFDPLATKMSAIPTKSSVPRFFHSGTALKDGSVLFSGGMSATSVPQNSSEVFVPASGNKAAESKGEGSWQKASSLKKARAFHRGALMSDGRVLVTGGRGPDPQSASDPTGGAHVHGAPATTLSLDKSTEIFDPKTKTWKTAPNTKAFHGPGPEPQVFYESHFTATALKNGGVLVVGGVTDDSGKNTPQDAAEVFKPSAGETVDGQEASQKDKSASATPATWLIGAGVLVAIVIIVLLVRAGAKKAPEADGPKEQSSQ